MQLEMLSPCRTHAPPTSLSAAQLAAQGSSSAAAMKMGSQSQQRKAELFSRFDVRETSFHVYTGRIDLHLCDDALPGKTYLSLPCFTFELIFTSVMMHCQVRHLSLPYLTYLP